MPITIDEYTPVILSLDKLRRIDSEELRERAICAGVENMTEDAARFHGFSNEEIYRLKSLLLAQTAYERRALRRQGKRWVPPMLLRGDYDETFNVYSSKPVEFIELMNVVSIFLSKSGGEVSP